MKKLMTGVLALAISFSLAACSKSATNDTSSTASSAAGSTSSATVPSDTSTSGTAATGTASVDQSTPELAMTSWLNAMVGADADTFAIIEPVLKAFCENIFHVGGPGAGHKTKLVYNFLTMGQAALISEAVCPNFSAR